MWLWALALTTKAPFTRTLKGFPGLCLVKWDFWNYQRSHPCMENLLWPLCTGTGHFLFNKKNFLKIRTKFHVIFSWTNVWFLLG